MLNDYFLRALVMSANSGVSGGNVSRFVCLFACLCRCVCVHIVVKLGEWAWRLQLPLPRANYTVDTSTTSPWHLPVRAHLHSLARLKAMKCMKCINIREFYKSIYKRYNSSNSYMACSLGVPLQLPMANLGIMSRYLNNYTQHTTLV